LGYVSEKDVNTAVAAQQGMEIVDLSGVEIPEEAINALPSETVQNYQVLPLEYDGKSKQLKIVLKSPDNFRAVDDIKMLMGYNVVPVVGDPEQVDQLLAKHYGGGLGVEGMRNP